MNGCGDPPFIGISEQASTRNRMGRVRDLSTLDEVEQMCGSTARNGKTEQANRK